MEGKNARISIDHVNVPNLEIKIGSEDHIGSVSSMDGQT